MSVIYTSGTTGQAKAVVQPWGMQELSRLLFSPPEFENCIFYGFWPPFHTLGKSMIFVPAAFDGKLVLRDRFSISDFWARRPYVRLHRRVRGQRHRELPARPARA